MNESTRQPVAIGEFAMLRGGECEVPVYVVGYCQGDAMKVQVLVIPRKRVEAAKITDLDAITITAITCGLVGCIAIVKEFGQGEIISEECLVTDDFPQGMLYVTMRGTLDPSNCSRKVGNLGQVSSPTPITSVALVRQAP